MATGTIKIKFTPIEKISFEEAIQELEEIVQKIELGNIPLDEAIEFYTRGELLKEYCSKKLDQAKLKIKNINFSSDDPILKNE